VGHLTQPSQATPSRSERVLYAAYAQCVCVLQGGGACQLPPLYFAVLQRRRYLVPLGLPRREGGPVPTAHVPGEQPFLCRMHRQGVFKACLAGRAACVLFRHPSLYIYDIVSYLTGRAVGITSLLPVRYTRYICIVRYTRYICVVSYRDVCGYDGVRGCVSAP
jgi:hypothetical protein